MRFRLWIFLIVLVAFVSARRGMSATKTARRQAALKKLEEQKAKRAPEQTYKARQSSRPFGRRLTKKKKRVGKRKPPVRPPSKTEKSPRNPMIVAAMRHREKVKRRQLEEARAPKKELRLPRANFHHFFNRKTKLAHHVDRPERMKRNAPPPPLSRMERLRMKKRNQDAIRALRARKAKREL